MKPARNSFLLSTFFVSSMIAFGGCRENAPVPRPAGSPLEIYDQAVAHFFKTPRDVPRALRLLEGACVHIPERRAQSCYNWGLFLQMNQEKDRASRAYSRAIEIEDLPVYRSALWSLEESPAPKGLRLQALRRAEQLCRNGKAGRALAVLRKAAPQLKAEAGFTRELIAQPLFKRCLRSQKEYAAWLQTLPAAGGDLAQAFYRHTAAADEFSALWDLESRLRGRERESAHPITRAWHAALRAGARGDGASAARALRTFLDALPRSGKERARAIGMRRAAGLLIQQTRYFARVRGHAGVQAVLAEALR